MMPTVLSEPFNLARLAMITAGRSLMDSQGRILGTHRLGGVAPVDDLALAIVGLQPRAVEPRGAVFV